MLKLNLGAADRHFHGYVSVDIAPYIVPVKVPDLCDGVECADLRQKWPWPDSSVDEILAFDIVEHLPDRIHTMNEMWRVLKSGARTTIETPNASRGAGYFQDPTHVSPWCMNSFQYFERGAFAHVRFARAYGITASFVVADLREAVWKEQYEETWKITAILEAVK